MALVVIGPVIVATETATLVVELSAVLARLPVALPMARPGACAKPTIPLEKWRQSFEIPAATGA